jgi:hypothetical protein
MGGIGDLKPRVFWHLIGTNDLGRQLCNVDAIVAGNIAMAEELMSLRPNSTIIINSLLSRAPKWWGYLSEVNADWHAMPQ